MVGLLDIAPQTTTVQVCGVAVDVFGISVKGIAALLKRFPALAKLTEGKGASIVDQLREAAPEAIASIIAIGCGYNDDSAAEAFAAELGIEAQLDLLTAIGGLTFPSGISPFVEKIGELSRVVFVSIGKVPDTKSQRQSNPSSQADTVAKVSGL